MSLTTAEITYNLANIVGVAHHQGTSVTVTTNIPDNLVVDTDGNQIRLGSGKGTIDPSGSGVIRVWVPGVGSNPASWQTYVHISYREPRATNRRTTTTLGPFTITASGNLADLIEEQAVAPTYAGQLVAELEAIRDDTIQISGIDSTDSAVAALVETPAGPLTQAALSATIATEALPATGPVITGQGLNLDNGDGVMLIPLTDANKANGQVIYGVANATGLAAGNAIAPIHLDSSTLANVDDVDHDQNVAMVVYNYTANGAGVVISNAGKGDGLYVQTTGTSGDGDSAGQTAWGINVAQGGPTKTTAIGDGVRIERHAQGRALSIHGHSYASASRELVKVTQYAASTLFDITNAPGAAFTNKIINITDAANGDVIVMALTGKTSGKALNVYQSNAAAYTGDVIAVNAGNGGGGITGKFLHFMAAGTTVFSVSGSGGLRFSPATTTTAPAAGAAGALPATPAGYMTINVNGTNRQVAYY